MKKKLFIISAIIIGILLGLYFSADSINSIMLPEYKLKDIEANEEAKLYKFWIIIDKDINEKDVERLGKQAIISLKEKNYEINTVIVFIYKDNKLYARVNFEKDEKDLISGKNRKYKDLYYTVDLENK
ncbi:hypothetical protein HMPREF9628_00137 [Peptoanaerobacter stomatis]|uniref:Uncharacterized protein n=1 Tax=Peptoanaerobacter stomatis TaxID=796937 RepID=G9XA46_9FIRM|nr:hypothetical protein [Peptoanaerobacter stomatis]EHL20292.1 hypothetical protein HMPREF9628_00137 [Peptoanaerobacter stomatis]